MPDSEIKNSEEFLRNKVERALKRQPLSAGKKDQAAFNDELIEELNLAKNLDDRNSSDDDLNSSDTYASTDNTYAKTQVYLNDDLEKLLNRTLRLIKIASEAHGQESVNHAVTKLTKQCQFKNIVFEHNTNHYGRLGPDVDAVFSNILNQKKLLAASRMEDSDFTSDTHNFVYLSADKTENLKYDTDKKQHIFVINPSPQLISKSVFSFHTTNEGYKTYHVGGNHAEVAWLLASICSLLDNPKLDAAACEQAKVPLLFYQILVPFEVDLKSAKRFEEGKLVDINGGAQIDGVRDKPITPNEIKKAPDGNDVPGYR